LNMAAHPKVKIRPYLTKNGWGFDVEIFSREATVADYLEALENVNKHFSLPCEGCGECCRGRLPLTLIDIFLLQEGLKGLTGKDFTLEDILERYCQVKVWRGAVDILLRTDAEGYCLFLYPSHRRCLLYPYRPLVCRTYYCLPQTRRARLLREQIINKGEDELVRVWLELCPYLPQGVERQDWPPTPFAGCTGYHQVKLNKIVPPEFFTPSQEPASK